MKLIVAGGRDFSDYQRLTKTLDHLLSETTEPVQIVSGVARGADLLAVRYAKEKSFSLKEFPANWKLHGNSAGYKRNQQMADYLLSVTGEKIGVVAFWDGKSRGTKHMIDIAKRLGIPVKVQSY